MGCSGTTVRKSRILRWPSICRPSLINVPIEAGLLASYGVDEKENYGRSADYIDSILKGGCRFCLCRLRAPDFHLARLRHQVQAEPKAHSRSSKRVAQSIADTTGRLVRRRG